MFCQNKQRFIVQWRVPIHAIPMQDPLLRLNSNFSLPLVNLDIYSIYRKKSSRRIKLDKSILQNSIAAMTWLDWLTWMMLAFFGILWSGIRMSWSTHTLASFVLLSIPIRDSQSTPKERWTFILVHNCKAYFMYTIDLTYDNN